MNITEASLQNSDYFELDFISHTKQLFFFFFLIFIFIFF